MSILKAAIRVIIAIKLLVAIPCLLWGGIIGVVGLGPDGFVPLAVRLAGLCMFFGAIGIAYPFSLFKPATRLCFVIVQDWMIALLSVLPFCLFVFLVSPLTRL